jgi:DNA-binding response OmpR family regulator
LFGLEKNIGGMRVAKTIMIVDDEEDVRTTVETILKKNGYRVITASNGDDCLKKLKTEKPDLILLDTMMPGMPVKEVIKKIKDTKIAYFTVVRTTEAEKKDLLKSKNIVDFIQKPFDMNEFLERVKKLTAK